MNFHDRIFIAGAVAVMAATEFAASWWMSPDFRENRKVPVLAATVGSGLDFQKVTPLPELYQRSAPMLRCSGGQVFRTDLKDGVSLHAAFFEWDGTDTGSVLEAFRHMPEACMGSLGMRLVSTAVPVRYRTGDATLIFDHTIFRDPAAGALWGAAPVHAFRAVWVSGMPEASVEKGVEGLPLDRLTTIRLKSAILRFRPPHARVIQGAVRGAVDGAAAWQAFEASMLRQIRWEDRKG